MHGSFGKIGIALAIALLAAGCSSNRTPELMHLRSTTNGPDEFGILPTKPLQMPESLTELPAPTPGGSNITDPTPVADAVTALGGKPPVAGKGVPAGDGALVQRGVVYRDFLVGHADVDYGDGRFPHASITWPPVTGNAWPVSYSCSTR